MKDYRNFILIENDKAIVQATFANCSSDVNYKCYNKEFPVKRPLVNYTDALRLLNKHLAQILQWKEDDEALSIYYVLVPPKLCKVIKEKLYKQWITAGEYNTGVKIKPEELNQWIIFDTLYRKTFADIAFKPNNIYSTKTINKSYRHIVFTKDIVDKMYIYLERLDEMNKVKTVNDLLK